jgi:hypothetical protein
MHSFQNRTAAEIAGVRQPGRVTTSGSVANLIPAPDRDEAAKALSLDNAMIRSRDGTGDSFCPFGEKSPRCRVLMVL